MANKQFFITGTSSGIGRALAEECLRRDHKVVGISRRKRIEHPNYTHLSYDLSEYRHYQLINFNRNRDADELVLVNNAGWLGEVKPLGSIHPAAIEKLFQINLIATAILCRLFVEQTQSSQGRRTVINISSGAARYPVPSWSNYCSSKAGLEMMTRVMALDHPEIRCWSVSPGVVDTEMQGEIRTLEEEDFPEVERFIHYKEKGELTSPAEVADKLLDMLSNPEKAPDIVVSLRDYQL
jgi:benzil reductase ((S)-benzoin forming)